MSLISFSGIASGIDSKSLITALLDKQRASQIKPISARINELNDANEALTNLKNLLSTLKSSLNPFRVVGGGGLAKTSTSSNEQVASATVSNSAQTGSYQLTVNQLARNANASFADRFDSLNAVINPNINNSASISDRTVSVTIGSGTSQQQINIEITNSTTASEFVNLFNNQTNNAQASLVNVGTTSSPSYAIVISSNNTGTEKGLIQIVTGNEIKNAGAGALKDDQVTLINAQNAVFSVSGINGTITRGSNQVSDLLVGVTFSLNSLGSTIINIQNDPEQTKKNLQKVIENFNEIFKFIKENDAVTEVQNRSNTENVFGPLASVSIDESIASQLRSSISASSISGMSINTLSDLGVTTERDGTLKLNNSVFNSAVSQNPLAVSKILENLAEKLASVDGVISQFTKFSGLLDNIVNSNDKDINQLQSRISDLEASLARQENSLNSQFARLESNIARLGKQQLALSSLLRG